MKVNILSPEGFFISQENFESKDKAVEYFIKWRDSFKTQGYYSTVVENQKVLIHIHDLFNHCKVIEIEPTEREKELNSCLKELEIDVNSIDSARNILIKYNALHDEFNDDEELLSIISNHFHWNSKRFKMFLSKDYIENSFAEIIKNIEYMDKDMFLHLCFDRYITREFSEFLIVNNLDNECIMCREANLNDDDWICITSDDLEDGQLPDDYINLQLWYVEQNPQKNKEHFNKLEKKYINRKN